MPYTVTTIAEAETAINALDTRVSALEAALATVTGVDLISLDTRCGLLEAADTSLDGRLTTAEASLAAAEADVAALQALNPVGAGRLIQLKRQGRI